ncbi:MAG TPA: four helix bundle protein [Burkholderiales bacterium]|nr:four helix bundle protein [Burkholderiales bacterium]
MRRKHHQLHVWQQAIVLVKSVYEATAKFPKEELYLLTSQMRRCAVSVPSNIAEGAARSGNKEFLQFLGIARGSLSELETQTLIAKELGYLPDDGALIEQIDNVFGLLGGLINRLRKTPSN